MVSNEVKKKIFPYISDVSKISSLKIDSDSLYYISIRSVSNQITNIIKSHINSTNIVITDATAGVGGNTLSFASTFSHVNAVEICKERYDFLCNNVEMYSYKNVQTYNDDYLNLYKNMKQDVVFLDPPWGGSSYKSHTSLRLYISNRLITTICKDLFSNKHCTIIVIKIPVNFDIVHFYEKMLFVCNNMYLYKLKKMNILVIT